MKKYLIFFIIIICFSSCIQNEECNIVDGYQFVIPATLSPSVDSFKIGDTISISSIFPDLVYERKTDQNYLLNDFKFFPATAISKIDETISIDALKAFELIIDDSIDYGLTTFSDGLELLTGEYLYTNNTYSLEFKIIPTQPGLYFLEQAVSMRLSPNQSFDNKCSNVQLDGGEVNLNGEDDNNIDFLSRSPDEHYNYWVLLKPEERFYQFGGYVFYVVE